MFVDVKSPASHIRLPSFFKLPFVKFMSPLRLPIATPPLTCLIKNWSGVPVADALPELNIVPVSPTCTSRVPVMVSPPTLTYALSWLCPDSEYLPSISTVNVSPSFLVKVMIPLPVLNDAPVTYSLLYEVRYPACE